jgi:hypothetical protein
MLCLQCIILSETCSGKNAEAAENSQNFQLFSIFQHSVTHSRVARAAHKAVAIKVGVCWVRVHNFNILAYIVLAIASIYQVL